jgi:dipeptidyl aminopeptidase/acylaminoacyl peptidase
LNEEKGSVFISWMKEQNLYWYSNKELKEFKNTQYYCISPLQNYIVLFPGDDSGVPKLVDIKSGKKLELPEKINHGWPSYASGLCFSPGESRLAYEDWSKEAISIYDLKAEKEMALLSEDGYSFIEASFSPNGKMIACLKVDNNNPPTEIGGEGRNPAGSKLVVYDVEKKKALTEIDGEPYIWSTSLWSPDGKYLIVNMADITSDNKTGVQIKGEPYLLNASNWKLKKLTTEESGTWLKQGIAWSADSKKVLVNSVDEKGSSQLWAADINMNDELNIEDSEYYILKSKKSGTVVYEVVKLNYKSIDKFDTKRNFSLSPGEKYALFTIEEDGMEYIIVSPAE